MVTLFLSLGTERHGIVIQYSCLSAYCGDEEWMDLYRNSALFLHGLHWLSFTIIYHL